ncbi:hypothetical protein MPSEU_000330400 [Mayamaea pseudoterrestris]|nr:hypothetical protein MPSEU_000330400 [Mayamaea pseudoterrestris]
MTKSSNDTRTKHSRRLHVDDDNDEQIEATIAESAKPKSRSRCCCYSPCCLLLIVALLVAMGGLLIWKCMPESSKSVVENIVSSGLGGNTTSSSSSSSQSSTQNAAATHDDDSANTPPTFDYYRCTSENDCCNGVDTICDLSVSQVLFAGLHNAYSSVEDGFLLAGNHEYSLEYALQAGFRAINVDLGNCNGELTLVHTKCELGRRDPYTVFEHINLFLDKHPRDLLLIPIQVNNDVDEPVDLWEFYSILSSIDGFVDRMYVHNETLYWPTMRELIELDKRIIVFVYNAQVSCRYAGSCPAGLHDWFLYASETVYEFASVDDVTDAAVACPYDRGDEGYVDFYALNMFVSDPLPSRASSQVINQPDFLQSHLATCESVVARNASVIFIDFWEEGNLVDLVQTHNQQLG